MPWLYPHFVSADDSTPNMSVHALLVEAPGMRLVVDTCVGNDRPREITGGEPLSTPFFQHLEAAGWSREGHSSCFDAAFILRPLRADTVDLVSR
jgi:hypothetical protein